MTQSMNNTPYDNWKLTNPYDEEEKETEEEYAGKLVPTDGTGVMSKAGKPMVLRVTPSLLEYVAKRILKG